MIKNLDGSIILQPWEIEALETLQKICNNTPYFIVGDKVLPHIDCCPPMTDIRFVYGDDDI